MPLVSDEMTRQVQSASPQDSLGNAARMSDALLVGALPVCDGERLAGMVTDRGIGRTSATADPSGTDAAGATGASGGSAATAGWAGTGVGARP